MGDWNIENGVLHGTDGELFLAAGAHSVLKFASGEMKPSQESIDNLAINLEGRHRASQDFGFKFAHVIAPEKYRVYPASFPVENPLSLAEQYAAAGASDFLDPVDELRAEAGGRTYGQNDTHWNAYGKIVISRLLAKTAGLPEQHINRAEAAARASLTPLADPFYGDLGRKVSPKRGEHAMFFKPTFTHTMTENGISHDTTRPVNEGRMIFSQSNSETAAKQRLLILGDSYLHLTLPALAFFFNEVLFCRTRWYHSEMVHMFKPDLVVTEQAERYLSHVWPDATAPNFLLIPQLLGRTPRFSTDEAQHFAMALSAGRATDFAPVSVKQVAQAPRKPKSKLALASSYLSALFRR